MSRQTHIPPLTISHSERPIYKATTFMMYPVSMFSLSSNTTRQRLTMYVVIGLIVMTVSILSSMKVKRNSVVCTVKVIAVVPDVIKQLVLSN